MWGVGFVSRKEMKQRLAVQEVAHRRHVDQLEAEIAEQKARRRELTDWHFEEQNRWQAQIEVLTQAIQRMVKPEPEPQEWSNPDQAYSGA